MNHLSRRLFTLLSMAVLLCISINTWGASITRTGAANFTLSSTDNTSSKALRYAGTQHWHTQGGAAFLPFVSIGASDMPAGEYEISFDFKFDDPADALVVNFRADASDGNDWERAVASPAAMLGTWQHATATYQINAVGSDTWTGWIELYIKTYAGSDESFVAMFDNIRVRNLSTGVVKFIDLEGETLGAEPTTIDEVHWSWGDATATLEQFDVTSVSTTPQTLWQIGIDDQSYAEFSSNTIWTYTIPSDWQTRTSWTDFPNKILRSSKPTLDISFTLANIPQYGVQLSLRTMQVSRTTPELAVYANGQFAGMIQTWGVYQFGDWAGDYQDVYQLYIPAEKLTTGSNVLRLETPLMPYMTTADADGVTKIGWDYLKLEQLGSPASEPIHGRVVYGGTTLAKSGTGAQAFEVDTDLVRFAQPLLEWMGIAYSGNTMRANFWIDVSSVQPARLALLEKYRDLNMTVVVDHISGAHAALNGDGTLSTTTQNQLNTFFSNYAGLFQYYEVSNEPCLIGKESLAANIEVAKYVNQIKPSHVKTSAPGYAYAQTGGTPDGWAAIPIYRLQLEQFCDTHGGHAYGHTYMLNTGGSYMETLAAFGPTVHNGFPREFIVTEFGTNNWHADNQIITNVTQPHAACFDRIMRSNIAVTDRFMHHASHFKVDDNLEIFSLFEPVSNWSTADPINSVMTPGVNGEESRLQTFRRLALAYLTHGTPLKYEILNAGSLEHKRVYVRPVNTSTLAPQPGSAATSNKVLLNFVNFEPTAQTVQARIDLPVSKIYSGVRIGAGNVLANARSNVSLTANPSVDVTVTLDARQSVQYILE